VRDSLTTVIPKLPEGTTNTFVAWLGEREITVRLSRPRSTKRGDFTPPFRGRKALITLNSDLGPYSLAITLTHELAHLFTWERYKRSVLPHGPEWKSCFSRMLLELAETESIPVKLKEAIETHAKRPKASTFRDINLYRTLSVLDHSKETWLESLNDGDEFISQGRRFRREKRRRKTCLCVDVATGRKYLVSLAATVVAV